MNFSTKNNQKLLQREDFFNVGSSLHWIHWVVIFGSFTLTLFAWRISSHQIQEKAETYFDKQADYLVELVSERMQKYEDALWAGVAMIQAQTYDVTLEEWKRFSHILNIEGRYKGINGIGVINYVSLENREAYIKERRVEQPGFNIFPAHKNSDLLPIRYIEPLKTNKEAVGLDMAHETNRYTAALRSRDLGKPKITGPIILVQDTARTPGFLFFAPYYSKEDVYTIEDRRKHFSGLVYAPFIMENLMEGTLERRKRQISVTIQDGDHVLYSETSDSEDYDPNPYLQKKITMYQYGRTWIFNLQTNKSFRNNIKTQQPKIILFGGLVIDALLIFLFFTMASVNSRAQKFGNKVRMQLEDSMNFQNLMLNAIPNLIFVKDKNFRIVECNDAFLNVYTEEDRDKIIGYTTVENFPENEVEEFLKNDKLAFETGFNEVIETISFPNGQIRELNTKKIRFYSAETPYILGISDDITDIKQAEREILRSNLELERFAYIASHDLQEPLRMISHFTQLLNDEYKDQFDSDAGYYMKVIVEHAGRMRDLIADLLEYSRMGQEEIGAEWIDPLACLEAVKSDMTVSIDETNTEITHDEFQNIFIPKIHFSRLLQNLISNAIKYRDKNRSSKIHISFEEDLKNWYFSIADNGIGIKEEYLKQIFVLFRRLQRKSEYSGTGIGLAICAKIVESFNGNIYATSTFGEGTTIHFEIPKPNNKKQ